MEKIITVTGKGSIHVVPDVIRLQLALDSIHDTYEEAYSQAKGNTDRLTKIMEKVGLPASQPKTTSLDIDKKQQAEYDKHGNHSGYKFVGFKLTHRVKIDLDMDTVILNKIVKLIGKDLKQAEINIGYTVKDPRPHQLRMLERAVKDAKEKAIIMTKACGCKLGSVKSIDYSEEEIHIYSQARSIHGAAEAECCNKESLDISPDDLVASDSVNVVWYIED